MSNPSRFWEERARRYAGEGAGLRAVCSYAMPAFYNWSIDRTQRHALRKIIASVGPGMRVLDYGCGVGRWSRELALRGAEVTAVDFSDTMLSEARRRTTASAYGGSCDYVCSDIAELDLGQQFDLILGVTVLQHVLEDGRLQRCIKRLAQHLRPGGRLVLIEAAPTRPDAHADTETFQARTLDNYLAAIYAAGLRLQSVGGVDPAPFKLWVVPRFRRWPRPLALGALSLATLCALPLDLLLARFLVRFSWHKIIVASVAEVAV